MFGHGDDSPRESLRGSGKSLEDVPLDVSAQAMPCTSSRRASLAAKYQNSPEKINPRAGKGKVFSGFLIFEQVKTMENHHLSWFSSGFPMVYHSFPWFHHGFPQPRRWRTTLDKTWPRSGGSSHHFFHGKTHRISTGPVSIANCFKLYQRVIHI